ncbi:MAG: hypothetical protein IJJ76_13470 [Ruminococcus sp.]|nr:hypothetical protein [Ruminococcus sp.]MBR0530759.1 hypothetical protein [Ruminococcus sp.]
MHQRYIVVNMQVYAVFYGLFRWHTLSVTSPYFCGVPFTTLSNPKP